MTKVISTSKRERGRDACLSVMVNASAGVIVMMSVIVKVNAIVGVIVIIVIFFLLHNHDVDCYEEYQKSGEAFEKFGEHSRS